MRRERAEPVDFRLDVVLLAEPALAAVEGFVVLHAHLPLVEHLVAGHAVAQGEAPPLGLSENATLRRLGVEARDDLCDGILGAQPPQQIRGTAIRRKRSTVLGKALPERAIVEGCKEIGLCSLRGQACGVRDLLEATTLPLRPRERWNEGCRRWGAGRDHVCDAFRAAGDTAVEPQGPLRHQRMHTKAGRQSSGYLREA